MAYFKWHGFTKEGNEASGFLLSPTSEEAELTLAYRGTALLGIKEIRGQSKRLQKLFIEQFIAKLTLLVTHNLPLHEALTIIARQTKNVYDHANTLALYELLITGTSLGESITILFPQTNPYITALIKSGEQTGTLGVTLTHVAAYLDHQATLRKKIITSAMSPLITLAFTATIVVVLLIAVVPQFESLFGTLQKQIPAGTQRLISIAHALKDPFSWGLAGLIGLIIYILWCTLRTIPRIRHAGHVFFLTIPLIGSVIIKLQTSRFLQILGLLHDASLPLSTAASLAQESFTNTALAQDFQGVTMGIIIGKKLSYLVTTMHFQIHLSLADLLAPTDILGINSKTVALATETLEDEANQSLSRIMALIGPVLLVIVALFIFAILFFLYLPLFNLANSI